MSAVLKSCAVCGLPFAPRGNAKTCGPSCSDKRSRLLACARTKAYYLANRPAILAACRGQRCKPPIIKACLACGKGFVATGTGRRKALTCGTTCAREYYRRARNDRPQDHPSRAQDVVRATQWRKKNPTEYKQSQRRSRERLSDSYVAKLLGLPVQIAAPLIPVARLQFLLSRELKGKTSQ